MALAHPFPPYLQSLVPGIVKRSLLQREMSEAKSYAQWRHAALELDELEGTGV